MNLYKVGQRVYTYLGLGTIRSLGFDFAVVELDCHGTATFLYRDISSLTWGLVN